LDVPEVDKKVGITVYATKSAGFGGVIRRKPEDFVVEEILTTGERASVTTEAQFSHLGRYLICVLVKRNWDTLLAVKAVAQQLGVSVERVAFAGIKDTRALTAQHISLYGFRPTEMERVRIRGVRVIPVRYSNEKISELLFGNRFNILISSIPAEEDEITRLVNDVQEELLALGGMPNFFGHQRFGTVRPVTHLVGKAIVTGDLEKAALVFLTHSSVFENPKVKEVRDKLLETSDFEEAIAGFPRRFRYERLMLRHLIGYPNDFVGALRRLPLRLRMLFVQAYQSFLFNRFLSEKIHQGADWCKVNVDNYVVALAEHGLPMKNGEVATTDTLSALSNDVVDGKACVAVPLVGYRQSLSEGAQGEIEARILEDEGIMLESFRCSAMPEVAAAGGLRAVLSPLIDFETDKPVVNSGNPSICELRLRFALRRGSYATIPLREFIKPQDPVKAGF
jgi:tRNA pseudouridine13 synthase